MNQTKEEVKRERSGKTTKLGRDKNGSKKKEKQTTGKIKCKG